MKKLFTTMSAMVIALSMNAQTTSESVSIKAAAFNYDLIVETPEAVQDLPAGIPDDHMCQRVSQGCLDELEIEGNGVADEMESGFTTAAGHAYKLMPYDANNAIVIQSVEGGASAEVEFEATVSAEAYNTLGLIAVSHLSDSYPTADITLHYADNTTETVTVEVVDWCQNPGGEYPAPIAAFNKRVRPTNDNAEKAHVENCENFFHEVSVPFTKDVTGLTIKNNVTAKHEWGWPVIVVMGASAWKTVEDGISTVAAETANQEIFNVAGQRMNGLQKGLNIVGGKKVIK